MRESDTDPGADVPDRSDGAKTPGMDPALPALAPLERAGSSLAQCAASIHAEGGVP